MSTVTSDGDPRRHAAPRSRGTLRSGAGATPEPAGGRPAGASGTRRAVTDRLMGLLDGLVRRCWAVVLLSEHVDIHADVIATEVSHRLAGTRDARLRTLLDG